MLRSKKIERISEQPFLWRERDFGIKYLGRCAGIGILIIPCGEHRVESPDLQWEQG